MPKTIAINYWIFTLVSIEISVMLAIVCFLWNLWNVPSCMETYNWKLSIGFTTNIQFKPLHRFLLYIYIYTSEVYFNILYWFFSDPTWHYSIDFYRIQIPVISLDHADLHFYFLCFLIILILKSLKIIFPITKNVS